MFETRRENGMNLHSAGGFLFELVELCKTIFLQPFFLKYYFRIFYRKSREHTRCFFVCPSVPLFNYCSRRSQKLYPVNHIFSDMLCKKHLFFFLYEINKVRVITYTVDYNIVIKVIAVHRYL